MTQREARVVLITGAAGNLGRATAGIFQQAGAHTVLLDRSSGRLRKYFPALDLSRHQFIEDSDLTDPPALAAAVSTVVERFGRVDVLLNTVGTFRGGKPVHEDELDTWRFLFDVNVVSTVATCRAVIPLMMSQGRGWIVNVGSQNAMRGGPHTAAYSAMKSAVVRLTESLAAELEGCGINVNCVLPGTMDTRQNREAMPDADTSTWVTPEEVAQVVRFLASEEARAIQGAALPVYGRG